ncbi:uncharacterized protein LOC111633457 isoform X2 [Centruroides sculpturatus]|uniref:uncharacterized protein LOC111633457 isoform X2 n=2 Tax=Centruroides sculpturatus TaxID=218467 RepID=UPI000C6D1ACA|nr:uncharacterized protein LOC111633457 isoform X2 [Centruroides sculpturatus]
MQISPTIRLKVTNFQQEICLKCFLLSFTSMSMIYGWNFFNSCSCVTRNNNYLLNLLKTFYLSLIECFYWLHFFLTFCMIIHFVSNKTPCISWYSIVDNDIFVKVGICILALVLAVIFSIVRRVKLNTRIKLRNSNYFRDNQLFSIINYTGIVAMTKTIILTLWLQLLNVFYFYHGLKKRESFKFEALFCSIEAGIWMNLMSGGLPYLGFFLFLFVVSLTKEFQKISEDLYVLRKDNPNLELELEEIMAQHHEMWSYTNQLNGPFNYVVTILYATLLTETCLLYFIAIFSKVEFALKVFIFLICALMTFLCVLVGFVMSVFTSNMQTSFQDTRIFADCDLSLEQKLKMLNFMKRFGKASLCLSMNDYFNVTKKFPIKMASSLHSVFSGLLKLRTATRRKN